MAGALLCAVAIATSGCGSSGPPSIVSVPSPDPSALSKAIADVKSGGTITLAAGAYQLSTPLTLDKPVKIVGQGSKKTEISCGGGEWVIKASGAGPYAFEGLTLRYTGGDPSDVVVVDGAGATFTRCGIAGATGSEDLVSAGIRASTTATCRVESCLLTENDIGFLAGDQATVQLENNELTDSRVSGILLADDAAGTIRGNCVRASAEAIWVEGSGEVAIEGNMVADSFDGITVSCANATVTGNRCEGNSSDGILLKGRAAGPVKDNIVVHNFRGISLADNVQCLVSNNRCEGNQDVGIRVSGTAFGRIVGNTCIDNGTNESGAICVGGRASMELLDNTCRQRASYGIMFKDKADGLVRRNTCSGAAFGIYVALHAKPKIGKNSFSGRVYDESDWRR